ncbi:hypothetical protein B0O44_103362 [Pedobacter nutrimenti]|uniref:Transposase/invertase (TIGR01784 family) n=2 Tax=Pedobacter nutrimenti TaxID=1241337 RepID=A0A318UEY7_9SPHI|nr:hypothetical protein B0O44_103362 [Pedobacter nutrimenti]
MIFIYIWDMYSIELKPVKSYCLREPSETYGRRGDDELWKGILEVVFKDFLRFFFEEADQLFDLEQDVVFLDKEFSSIFPAEENAPGVRFVDKLVKVRLKDGSGERFILVHVEVQGQKSHEELSERMFRYYYRIKDKYNISTTAFAILTDREKGYHPRVYVEEFLGTRLSYQFNTYKLLEQDEASLRANPNPFAMVALVGLQAIKYKKAGDQELRLLKLDLIRALNKRNISIEKHSQIMEFLQYYITFKNPRNMLKFEEEVAELTGRTKPIGVGEILLDRAEKRGLKKGEERGMEKGIEKGMEKGIEKGLEKGIEKGLEKGRNEVKSEMVSKILLKKGYSEQTILEIIELLEVSRAFIQKVYKGNQKYNYK